MEGISDVGESVGRKPRGRDPYLPASKGGFESPLELVLFL